MSNWDWFSKDDDNDDSEFVEIQKSYSDNQIIEILKEEGYSNIRKPKSQIIVFESNSINFILENQPNSLRLLVTYSDMELSPRKINEWNKTRRFSRAYINEDNGQVCIDFDLNLEEGASKEQIVAFIKKFVLVTTLFAIFAYSA